MDAPPVEPVVPLSPEVDELCELGELVASPVPPEFPPASACDAPLTPELESPLLPAEDVPVVPPVVLLPASAPWDELSESPVELELSPADEPSLDDDVPPLPAFVVELVLESLPSAVLPWLFSAVPEPPLVPDWLLGLDAVSPEPAEPFAVEVEFDVPDVPDVPDPPDVLESFEFAVPVVPDVPDPPDPPEFAPDSVWPLELPPVAVELAAPVVPVLPELVEPLVDPVSAEATTGAPASAMAARDVAVAMVRRRFRKARASKR